MSAAHLWTKVQAHCSVLWSRFDAANANASQDGVPHGSFELVVDYDASTISKDDIVGDGIIPLTYDGIPNDFFH